MAANFDESEAFRLLPNSEPLHGIFGSVPDEGRRRLFEDAQCMVEPELECSSSESEDGGGSADANFEVQCTQIPQVLHSPTRRYSQSQSHLSGTQGNFESTRNSQFMRVMMCNVCLLGAHISWLD